MFFKIRITLLGASIPIDSTALIMSNDIDTHQYGTVEVDLGIRKVYCYSVKRDKNCNYQSPMPTKEQAYFYTIL